MTVYLKDVDVDGMANIVASEHTTPGPICSKLMTSLVNERLKFHVNISDMPIFFVEKTGEAFAMQKLFPFFQQKISMYWVVKL